MGDAHDYHHGEMDVAEQAATFHSFILLSKWGSLIIASVLTFFIVWLCAHATFIASLIVGVLVAAVGFLVLREGKSASH